MCLLNRAKRFHSLLKGGSNLNSFEKINKLSSFANRKTFVKSSLCVIDEKSKIHVNPLGNSLTNCHRLQAFQADSCMIRDEIYSNLIIPKINNFNFRCTRYQIIYCENRCFVGCRLIFHLRTVEFGSLQGETC